MPFDPKLNLQYFMKNRDRLLKFIRFVKENTELTDNDLESVSIQKKIIREGLGLRDSYTLSAIACLPNFVKSFGGVTYFRTTPLELIAGHRALAVYVALCQKDDEYIPGKCPYYKCSPVSAAKLYKQIFDVCEKDEVPKENLLAMQHVLQCNNYCKDYFDLKKNGFEITWSDEELITRVREFVLQQVSFLKKRDENVQNLSENVENSNGGQACEIPHSSGTVGTEEHKSMSPVSPLRRSLSTQCAMMDQHKDKCSEVTDENTVETPSHDDDIDDENCNYAGIEVKESGAVSTINPSTRSRKGREVNGMLPIPRVSGRARKAPKKLQLYYC